MSISRSSDICEETIAVSNLVKEFPGWQCVHIVVVVVVVVNFIKHQNRAITGERVAARAAPSYQYAMVLVIIT